MNHFFDIYEKIDDTHKLISNKIFNVDESEFQTTQKKPQKKVVGDKVKKVGALEKTSGCFNLQRGRCKVACACLSRQWTAGTGDIVTVTESDYINQ